MFKFFAVVVSVAALMAGPVAAQTSTTATAAPPSARQIELANELVEVSGARQLYASAMGPMLKRIFAGAMSADTPDQKKMAAAVEGAMTDAMSKIYPKMLAAVSQSYASTYTEEELTAIINFYKSPPGRAMVTKAPVLTEKLGESMVAIMPQMRTDMINDLCDRLSCTPDQRSAMLSGKAPPHS